MKVFIIISGILIIGCLVAEKYFATRHRFAIKHVIHVNGTRGKSAVTRLIAAGIAESGMKTYCKTTGTLPMTIDTAGEEREIKRRGKANIAEQIRTLRDAALDGAEVLVVECMAVDPELQFVCQEKILKADIGVITNARIDHVAEMGGSVSEVCDALSGTIPRGGRLFTADNEVLAHMKERAEDLSCEIRLASITDYEDNDLHTEDFDIDNELFPENIALALSVCEAIGIDRKTALRGMAKVQADPYEAAAFPLESGGTFVNAMSANDPVSTKMVYERFAVQRSGKLIIILNCRSDRGYRTDLMIEAIEDLKPGEVWLIGRGSAPARRKLEKRSIKVTRYSSAEDLPLNESRAGDMILAIGNIADDGIKLMDIVEGKGEKICTDK